MSGHSTVWFYNFYSVVSKLYTKWEGPDSEATTQDGDEDDPDGEPSSDEEPQRLVAPLCKTALRKNATIY